jgi:hypothetical protein
MKGLLAFFNGFGIQNLRPAIYAWFANLVLSMIIFIGFFALFTFSSGKTLMGDQIHTPTGLSNFFIDILYNFQGNLFILVVLSILMAVIYLFTSIFIAGGIYSILITEEKINFRNLLNESLNHFFSMFKIALINLINLTISIIFPAAVCFLLLKAPFSAHDESALRLFIYSSAFISLILLIFSISIYDFSRIIRLKTGKNTIISFKNAIKSVFSNKINLLLIYLIYAITLFFLFLISIILENLFYPYLLFFLHQMFMLIRYFFKIVVMRAEIKILN